LTVTTNKRLTRIKKELKKVEKLIEIVSPSSSSLLAQSHPPLLKSRQDDETLPLKVERPSFKVPESPKKTPSKAEPTVVVKSSPSEKGDKKYGLVLPAGGAPRSVSDTHERPPSTDSQDKGSDPPETSAGDSNKRKYGVVTQEEAEKDYALEEDDVEVAPDLKRTGTKRTQMERLNAAYGY
jgi:hypothetical protein